jgi:hypothetical protein
MNVDGNQIRLLAGPSNAVNGRNAMVLDGCGPSRLPSTLAKESVQTVTGMVTV